MIRKIAIITNPSQTIWLSRRTIASNMVGAYEKAFGKSKSVRYFEYSGSELRTDALRLAREIAAFGAERITFAHLSIPPTILLHALDSVYAADAKLEFFFHLDGNFSQRAAEWLAAEETLKGRHCRFICASSRHARFVGQFLVDGVAATAELPFSVGEPFFKFSASRRRAWRRKMGIKAHAPVFVYAGRLSLQKNVDLLIRVLGPLMTTRFKSAQLLLVGPLDHLGMPYFGREYPHFQYEGRLRRALAELPADVQKRVRFPGTLTRRDLAGVFNAADTLVSLSLHHDEDYGMAVAEAALCGLPAILTDWGGHADFKAVDAVFAKTRLTRAGLTIDCLDLGAVLAHAASNPKDAAQRAALGRRAVRRYSVDAVAHGLLALYKTKGEVRFKGFSSLLRQLIFHSQPDGTIYEAGPRKGAFYETIYSSYLA